MNYQAVIGMEVHCELKTRSKMFCACANGYGLESEPNINICPVCLAHPGALPTANVEAIKMVVRVGLALESEIPTLSKFDRKNYFYPDLPKGYQISQYDQPISKGGQLSIGEKTIRVTRVHLEEDTGKLAHPAGADYSLVDYNRSSVPLMELVTEPDIATSGEAKKFCQELQLLLRATGVSDADMERGQMRCEANISLMPADKERTMENFGTKVEVKNINSFKAVERAIEYEIKRQAKLLDAGEIVSQETRGWDETKGETFPQRKKESAHDYRYFPDPDLPPLVFGPIENPPAGAITIDVEEIRRTMPELPQAKRHRFIEEYGFGNEEAFLLSADENLASFTENVFSELRGWLESLEGVEGTVEEIFTREKKKMAKLVSGWMTTELFKLMNESNLKISETKITAENFAEFLALVYTRKINSSAAQVVLREMFATGQHPQQIVDEKDLHQVDDTASLEATIDQIIAANPSVVAEFKGGKDTSLQFLIGQAMKATKGKGNPQKLQELFRAKLS